ncbi:MAG: histone deacetylase [Ignavibacteria bacterium]|nr:histone deacetylase [Ignavibacteria bacterium]
MSRTGFLYDEQFLEHDTGYSHPETADRLAAIVMRLSSAGLLSTLHPVEALPTDLHWLERTHSPAHVEAIRAMCADAPFRIDVDTPVCKRSFDVAVLAAGGVLEMCARVMNGELRNGFCAVRPPGHHAEKERAMGFCLFNNVAVAATFLREERGANRVLIVDWDVHHGNGTQNIFYEDPNVFFISMHQSPLYPGTGAASEKGAGAGEGRTLNLPMPPGSTDDHYREAFEDIVLPAAKAFAPDFVLLSAGFDAHRDDPLANIALTESGFAYLTTLVREIAEDCCDGRLVSVLEGGYNLDALARSAAAHVRALRA